VIKRVLLASALMLSFFVATTGVAAAVTLKLDRTIQTTPFLGWNGTMSMGDNEGSAFVPIDNSLWLADPQKDRIYETSPTTTAMRRPIFRDAFDNAPQIGGGPIAGPSRTSAFEAMAYDLANDFLYVFSRASSSDPTVLPTAFRLTRQSGSFYVESWQALPAGYDFLGAAWNPTDGKLYVGKGRFVRSFDYGTGTQGPSIELPGVTGITGMDFKNQYLFVTSNTNKLFRVNWNTKTITSGWSIDLAPFGIGNPKAVSVGPGPLGLAVMVSDGADNRPPGDPLRHAAYVFHVE
jgi:hypothetical protein